MEKLDIMIRKLSLTLLVVVLTSLVGSCTCFLCPHIDKTRHIAKEGDTLGKIAQIYYGSPEKVALILRANPKLNPDRPLIPGQLIQIPYTN